MSLEKNNSLLLLLIISIVFVFLIVLLKKNKKKKNKAHVKATEIKEKKILNVPLPPLQKTTYSTTGTSYPIFTKVIDKNKGASSYLEAKTKNTFNYNVNTNEINASKFNGSSNSIFSSNTDDKDKLIYQSGESSTGFIPKPTTSGNHVLSSNGVNSVPIWKKFTDVLRLEGAKGPKGDDGPVGIIGDQGSMGDQGPVGSQGPQGLIGTQGPQGDKGDTGLSGSINVPYQNFVLGLGGSGNYTVNNFPSVNKLGIGKLGANGNYGTNKTIFSGFPHTYKDYKTALANEFGKTKLVWSSTDEIITLV